MKSNTYNYDRNTQRNRTEKDSLDRDVTRCLHLLEVYGGLIDKMPININRGRAAMSALLDKEQRPLLDE